MVGAVGAMLQFLKLHVAILSSLANLIHVLLRTLRCSCRYLRCNCGHRFLFEHVEQLRVSNMVRAVG